VCILTDNVLQVQLATEHTTSFPYPAEPTGGQSIASQIVTAISKVETDYHMELNDVYGELGDKAFRA
jgi:capping protein alpha